MNAREEVLARIAAAHSAAPPPDLPYGDIIREYRTTSDSSAEALTELLIDRLVDYRALVRQCSGDDLAATIADALADRSAHTVVVPSGLDSSWTAGFSGSVLTDGLLADYQRTVSELDSVDGVRTSADRQFRMSPGGRIPSDLRSCPELPPSSITVTTAVTWSV